MTVLMRIYFIYLGLKYKELRLNYHSQKVLDLARLAGEYASCIDILKRSTAWSAISSYHLAKFPCFL